MLCELCHKNEVSGTGVICGECLSKTHYYKGGGAGFSNFPGFNIPKEENFDIKVSGNDGSKSSNTKQIEIRCKNCNKSFSNFVSNRRIFCSRECYRQWQSKNKEYYPPPYKGNGLWAKNPKKYQREWGKEKRRKNTEYRLNNIISPAICLSLKGKKAGRRWEKLVGYTVEDLIKHLEKQFDDKMNWDNYGSYWEIDHIKPKSLFHYRTSEDIEFIKCWGLDNLQPLEKTKNRKKHNKYG